MTWLNEIFEGDALTYLKSLPDGCIDTCFTSPPYHGLRDYGTARWQGGDPDCKHRVGGQVTDGKAVYENTLGVRPGNDNSRCRKCGAERIDKQLGLEATQEEYVENLVVIFRELRRVLAEHGTFWLNLGDTYATTPNGRSAADTKAQSNDDRTFRDKPFSTIGGKFKAKDLCGVPWAVATALRDDGWWLRSAIVWEKKNPMPESMLDRPTSSYEHIFLFAKTSKKLFWLNPHRVQATNQQPEPDYYWTHEYGFVTEQDPQQFLTEGFLDAYIPEEWKRTNRWSSRSYWYDAFALREPHLASSVKRDQAGYGAAFKGRHTMPGEARPHSDDHEGFLNSAGSNARNVWHFEDTSAWMGYFKLTFDALGTELAQKLAAEAFGEELGRDIWLLATEATKDAHFATFPTELVQRVLLAGCPPTVCAECNSPYVRLVGRAEMDLAAQKLPAYEGKMAEVDENFGQKRLIENMKLHRDAGGDHANPFAAHLDLGFHPTCDCDGETRPGIVLDMFSGAGTVFKVAERMNLDWTGSELNLQYIEIALRALERERHARSQGDPYQETLVLDEPGLTIVQEPMFPEESEAR